MNDNDLTQAAADREPRLPAGSKVLVTGVSGFVGGQLAECLAERQAEVVGLIRSTDRAGRAAQLPIQLVTANLANAVDVARAVDAADYVFHCAYDGRSRKQNIDGLHNLIEACLGSRVRRLVQVSTFAVYEPFPDGPLTEQTRDGDRSNSYVDIKLELERIIFKAVRDRGLSATIIQPAVVYGPFCSPWTNTPAEQLLFGHVILPDNGEGICNAVYIDDLVDALILAAINPAAVGKRFIVSGPETISWRHFFSEIANAVGAGPPQFWPLERILQARRGAATLSYPGGWIDKVLQSETLRENLKAALPGFVRTRMKRCSASRSSPTFGQDFVPNQQQLAFYCAKAIATSEKARTELGYRPRFDFQRGMEPTAAYLKSTYQNAHTSDAGTGGSL